MAALVITLLGTAVAWLATTAGGPPALVLVIPLAAGVAAGARASGAAIALGVVGWICGSMVAATLALDGADPGEAWALALLATVTCPLGLLGSAGVRHWLRPRGALPAGRQPSSVLPGMVVRAAPLAEASRYADRVEIRRAHQPWSLAGGSLSVSVDGTAVVRLRQGEAYRADLPAGVHSLRFRLGRYEESDPVRLDARGGYQQSVQVSVDLDVLGGFAVRYRVEDGTAADVGRPSHAPPLVVVGMLVLVILVIVAVNAVR